MKAQKAKFGFNRLNAKITLMLLDNQVSADIFGKNILLKSNVTAAESLLVTFFEYV